MLSRLHIRGFKNLFDVDLRFGPFTCIIGENGAGKSNLFDAIRFLHLLADHPVPEAVRQLRETSGRAPSPDALFTSVGSYRSPEMRFTAEMLVNLDVEDDFGAPAHACISSLRYDLAFQHHTDHPGGLRLVHESLEPIKLSEARSTLGFPASRAFKESAITGRRTTALMTTSGGTVRIHQEGNQGRAREIPLARSQRPVIQSASAEFPTLLAARRELQSWRTLMLEPSAMRAPSAYNDDRHIDSRGANLPATLQRLCDHLGPRVWAGIANRLAELLPDIRSLRIDDDPKTESHTLAVAGPDGVFHHARSLSDGTLRFLVLATLMADPQERGTLCLEEPENGIHPDRVASIVRLLHDIAVDADATVGDDNPLRQVIVNTHSPLVFREVEAGQQVFLEPVQATLASGVHGTVGAVRVPEGSWRAQSSISFSLEFEFARVKATPLSDRIAMAAEAYPCDILFVHRDAESRQPAERIQEISEALSRLSTPRSRGRGRSRENERGLASH